MEQFEVLFGQMVITWLFFRKGKDFLMTSKSPDQGDEEATACLL